MPSAFTSRDSLEDAEGSARLLGLRHDRMDADYASLASQTGVTTAFNLKYNEWSYRSGLLFQPSELVSYYASFGTSYNTSGDTYQFGNPGANTARAANTDPEKSRNFEIGTKMELFERRALLGVAAFYSEKYNERNTDPDSASSQMLLSGKRIDARLALAWGLIHGIVR